MMNQTNITLPQPTADAETAPPRLSSELDRRIAGTEALARREGVDVRFVDLRKMPKGVERLSTENRDWVIAKVADDPAVKRYKKFFLTPRVKQDLTRIREAGLAFDEIVIAHELPKGTLKRGRRVTADMLMPPRREVVIQTGNRWANAAEEINSDALPTAVAAGAGVIGALVAVAQAITDAGGAMAHSASEAISERRQRRADRATSTSEGGLVGFLLDPIIFGILRDQESDQAAWFYLTHWTWGDEE